jgi:IS66 Orf2 like protein
VMVATKPVDFRKGAEGLAALVRDMIRADPFSGVVYVFRAKRADRVKLIFWDGTGVVLVAKRLEDGAFRWPIFPFSRPITASFSTIVSCSVSIPIEPVDSPSRDHDKV